MNCQLCERPVDCTHGRKRKKFATGAPITNKARKTYPFPIFQKMYKC